MSDTHSSLPADRLWQPTTAKWFATLFGGALVYAIIRYHLAGDVAWAHFPLFIFNKATSLAAVFFVASSYLVGKVIHWHDHDKALRLVVIKFCGLVGFFLAGIHALLSLSLLSPAYYGKYFGSPDIKVGRSPGRSDQELCDLGRNRLIHGFFWDLPEQYFLASVDGRLRRPRSGWGACSAAAKSRRKVFNLWLLLDDRWAGDTAQVVPVR